MSHQPLIDFQGGCHNVKHSYIGGSASGIPHMKHLSKAILFVWFLFVVFEAPLRYTFVKLNAPFLIYLKDFLLFIPLLWYFLLITYTGRINYLVLFVLSFLMYGLIIGYLNGIKLPQLLFGAKIFITFLAGFIFVSEYQIEEESLLTMFRILIPIVFLGLFLDLFFALPWEGLSYKLGSYSIEGSRQWTTFGIPRLAGFGRTSFESAILLFSFSALAMTILAATAQKTTMAKTGYDILLIFCSFAGVLLTTSKTSLVAFLMFFVFYLLIFLYNGRAQITRFLSSACIRLLVLFLFLVGILLPIASFIAYNYWQKFMFFYDIKIKLMLASLFYRVVFMWQDAFELLEDDYVYFTGRGLGGIGAAQEHFEKNLFNPADNLYIYLYAVFGPFILFLIIIYILQKAFSMRLNKGAPLFWFAFAIIFFSFAPTLNVIESGGLMMTLSILLGLFWRRSRIERDERE
jgi:hypothetical protein